MNNSILYIEATSGISGDMLLGAFLDLDVPIEAMHQAWTQLGLDNYEIEVFETRKSGMRALRCRVRTEEEKGPRTWKEYQQLLNRSKLKEAFRKDALTLCKKLFEIEAAAHKLPLNKLRLHEMGGTDLLIDIVGTLAAVDYLQPSGIHASSVNTGKGFITFSHGRYPVPAPATSKLLEGIPIFQNEIEGELTTPTGALLLTYLAGSYGELPPMKLQKTGAGAGEREIAGRPNVLRIFMGSVPDVAAEENVYLVETNIDDSSSQILAHFMEKAFEQGALDVFFTPIFMKKNRPAVRLSFLTQDSQLQTLIHLLFSETTAIGLRYWKVGRQKLERRWHEVRIGKFNIRIKEGLLDGTLYNYQPEYEDCKLAAEKLNRPVKEIIAEAIHRYLSEERR